MKAIDLDHEVAKDYEIKICSQHFSRPDFEEKGKELCLKFGAVPSLNMKMKDYVYELPRFDAKKFQDYKKSTIAELSQDSNKGCIDKLKKMGLLKPENAGPGLNRVMPPVTMMPPVTLISSPIIDKPEPKTVFKITPYLNASSKPNKKRSNKQVEKAAHQIKEIPVIEVQNPRKKIVMYPPDPLEISKKPPRPCQPLGMAFENPIEVKNEPSQKSFVSAFTNFHQITSDSVKKMCVPDHQNYTQNVNKPVTRSSNVLPSPAQTKSPAQPPFQIPLQAKSLVHLPLPLQAQFPPQVPLPVQVRFPDPRECLQVVYNLPNQVQVPIRSAPIPSVPPAKMPCVQCIVKDKKIARLEKTLAKHKKMSKEYAKKVKNLQRAIRRKDHRMEILKEKLEIFGNLKGKLKIMDLNDVEIVYETVNDDGTMEEEIVNLGEKRKAKKLKSQSVKKKKVEDLEDMENGHISDMETEENQEENEENQEGTEENQEEIEEQFQEVFDDENQEENTLKLECEEEEDLIVYDDSKEQEDYNIGYSDLEIQVLDDTWQA